MASWGLVGCCGGGCRSVGGRRPTLRVWVGRRRVGGRGVGVSRYWLDEIPLRVPCARIQRRVCKGERRVRIFGLPGPQSSSVVCKIESLHGAL
mgnify:CR=1 FL=1